MSDTYPLKKYLVALQERHEGELLPAISNTFMAEDYAHAEEQALDAYPHCYIILISCLSGPDPVPEETIVLDPKGLVEIPQVFEGTKAAPSKEFDILLIDKMILTPPARENQAAAFFRIGNLSAEEWVVLFLLPQTPIREFLGEFIDALRDKVKAHVDKHREYMEASLKMPPGPLDVESIQVRRVIDHNGKSIVP